MSKVSLAPTLHTHVTTDQPKKGDALNTKVMRIYTLDAKTKDIETKKQETDDNKAHIETGKQDDKSKHENGSTECKPLDCCCQVLGIIGSIAGAIAGAIG